MEYLIMESQSGDLKKHQEEVEMTWRLQNLSSSVGVYVQYCPLWEGVVRCVIEAGIQEHAQGSQGGDDDKQPQEETVHH